MDNSIDSSLITMYNKIKFISLSLTEKDQLELFLNYTNKA